MIVHTRRVLAGAAALATIGCMTLPAAADAPASGADINGQTVYLKANAALRYGKSLLSRVYTRSGTVLELKGTGPCTTFNCPVVHNGVQLFVRRVRLDLAAPVGQPISSTRTMRNGDEGTDVRELQQALVARGYKVKVDGKFDLDTEDAVKAFQKAAGLGVDGAVGPKVREALLQTPGKSPSPIAAIKEKVKDKIADIKAKAIGLGKITRILRRGDEGDDVRILQEVLVARGYDVKVDGKYGYGTWNAVRDFQSKNGLSADGNTGPQTLDKLASA